MANHVSAIKRIRQTERRYAYNRIRKSKMRTLLKKALTTQDSKEGDKLIKQATSYIDRMVCKGIIHKKNAAKKKSKLALHMNTLTANS